MTTETKALPDKLSGWIRLGLEDMEKCEASGLYVIDMENWHRPNAAGLCRVCIAGSVIAMTGGFSPNELVLPCDTEFDRPLLALNWARRGWVREALNCMGIYGHRLTNRYVVPYAQKPAKFKEQMLALADDLEREGL